MSVCVGEGDSESVFLGQSYFARKIQLDCVQ